MMGIWTTLRKFLPRLSEMANVTNRNHLTGRTCLLMGIENLSVFDGQINDHVGGRLAGGMLGHGKADKAAELGQPPSHAWGANYD